MGRLIIRQLQKDLQYERDRSGQLDAVVAKERQKYNDLYVEYEYLKNASPKVSSEFGYKFASYRDSEKYLREKNFELERYNSELELKIETTDKETQRLGAELLTLEAELRGERARNMAGMSAEQLTRMQQAGSNILLEMEDFSTNVYAKEQIAVKLFAQKALFSFLEICLVLAKYSILALGKQVPGAQPQGERGDADQPRQAVRRGPRDEGEEH